MPDTLNSLIDSRYKYPTATVRLNSNKLGDVLSISVNSALDGGITSASIRTMRNPNVSPEARVLISQGYNTKEQLVFTGFVDTIERNESDNSYTINCRDVLKKALDTFLIQEVKFGQDLTAGQYYYSTWEPGENAFHVHQYSSLSALNAAHPETTGNYSSEGVLAEAVVQWLLHMSGLEEGSEIQVDPTNFFVGDLTPAKFHLTSVYDAAMQIANLIGWRIYADPSGVARFRKRPRQPGGYTYWNYTDKGEPYNIHKLTKTSSNIDLRNYVEVRGASGIRVIRSATSPYIGNTAYRGVLISDELIDTQGIAEFVATRVLQDLNRLKVTLTMEADGNPLLVPGSTVDIRSNTTTGKYLVEQLQTTMTADAGYRMNINAAAYLGDTVFDEDPEPVIVAAFVPTFISVLGDPKWIVRFDGASSYSDRGIITRYVWSWPDSTTTDSSDSSATFVFDEAAIIGGNSQNVTLTVYDSVGNSAFTTQAITTSGLTANVTVKYRALYAALTTQAVGSIDGGQSWITNTIPAVSVAASNFGPGGLYVPSGHALFGTSDGNIYKTVDTCASMSLKYSPGSRVTDLHIPELDSNKAAAVTEAGYVYYSDDSGETWRQIGSFPFSLREVKLGFTDFKNITVVGSGLGNVYTSYDTGSSWTAVGTDTIDTLWATDGAQTNYFAHTNGILGSGPGGVAELTFSGGGSFPIPAATVMIDRDDGVMAVDAYGQSWTADDTVLYATQNNPANLTRHMIRDGEMETIVYYATQSGISKSLDRNTTLQELYYPSGSPPAGGWGQKVAYGPLAGVILPGQLIFRGTITTVDGQDTPGWYIATTSGWRFGCADPGGLIAAAGVGVFAIGESAAVHMIKCIPASGSSVVGFAQLELHENWVIPATAVEGIFFNRLAGSRDMLCLIEAGGTGLDINVWAESIPDFVNDPGTVISEMLEDGNTFLRDFETQQTNSVLGETYYRSNYTLFSNPHHVSVYFNADSITYSSVSEPRDLELAPRYKAATQYKGIARRDFGSSSEIHLLTGYNGTDFTEADVNIPTDVLGWQSEEFELFEPQLYGSCTDQAKIYYATLDGVYSIDGYGQGSERLLLDPTTLVASGTIQSLNVNYERDYLADYLCAVVGGYPGIGPGGLTSVNHCFYSTDGGSTWLEGPILYDWNGSRELYFMDIDS